MLSTGKESIYIQRPSELNDHVIFSHLKRFVSDIFTMCPFDPNCIPLVRYHPSLCRFNNNCIGRTEARPALWPLLFWFANIIPRNRIHLFLSLERSPKKHFLCVDLAGCVASATEGLTPIRHALKTVNFINLALPTYKRILDFQPLNSFFLIFLLRDWQSSNFSLEDFSGMPK